MVFYFCGQYVNTTDADDKEAERDMFMVVKHF